MEFFAFQKGVGNIEKIKTLVIVVLAKLFGEVKRNSFDNLLAEFYRAQPDEFDGALYPVGAFSKYDEVWVACGSLEFNIDGDEGDDTVVYAVYTSDLSLCYVTLVTNDKPVFSFCKF